MNFNWKSPDYEAVTAERIERLKIIRSTPDCLPAIKDYYRQNPADFINDWGMTFDPRNADIGLPTLVPFVLFPKQREFVQWTIDRWRAREPGICEKSRDMGISWLLMCLFSTLCLFMRGLAIGVGSRKTEYVDKSRSFKPLLPKARIFVENLPEEFRGGWVAWRDAPFMRVTFPETGSIITGEGGDNIGRGDRSTIYLVDEAAHLPAPELVDAALSQTTNCRIDVSSVNGMNNPFAKKRHAGKINVFVFDWRDDPRKDQAWYDKQCLDHDPIVVAQEIDRDYLASVSGVVIPGPWVRAAIGAIEKLGIAPTGRRTMAMDVADEGIDKNALVGVHGVLVDFLEEFSGKGGDIFQSTERAFELCDERGYDGFRYDADGLGAGVRGDARIINERRKGHAPILRVEAFRGSEAVFDPDGIVEGTIGMEGKGRTNKDYFANRKAQGWWFLRSAFKRTFRWVVQGQPCNGDQIISLDPKMPLLHKLTNELCQPTYGINKVGKILINKKPDGMPSPNLADGVMIRYAPNDLPPMNITADLIQQIVSAGRRRR